jgi:chondroitin 4-sulfotransferase 11
VRHPFDRLVSAWNNKFSQPNQSCLIQGRLAEIASEYLQTIDPFRSSKFDPTRESLTLEQFLHLVSEKINSGFKNHHWASFYETCLPCHIHYDHVFRLETLSRDITSLYDYLRHFNETKSIPTITHANEHRAIQSQQKMEAMAKIYKDIEVKIKLGLQRVYGRDLTLFGYKWENGTASCVWKQDNCC